MRRFSYSFPRGVLSALRSIDRWAAWTAEGARNETKVCVIIGQVNRAASQIIRSASIREFFLQLPPTLPILLIYLFIDELCSPDILGGGTLVGLSDRLGIEILPLWRKHRCEKEENCRKEINYFLSQLLLAVHTVMSRDET